MQRPLSLAALVLIVGCTRNPSIAMCEIINKPEKYNGSHVTISGIFRQGHYPMLMDSKCPYELIVLGSEVNKNLAFRDAVSANYLSDGSSITASIEGKFIYTPSPNPDYLLDDYTVMEFKVGRPSSPH